MFPDDAPLAISAVRIEPAPAEVAEPAAVLRFTLEHHGITQLADIVLRVAIHEKATDATVLPRAIVRPFDVRTDTTLEPGHSIEYELLFRNLSAGCACVPTVAVVSAKALNR